MKIPRKALLLIFPFIIIVFVLLGFLFLPRTWGVTTTICDESISWRVMPRTQYQINETQLVDDVEVTFKYTLPAEIIYKPLPENRGVILTNTKTDKTYEIKLDEFQKLNRRVGRRRRTDDVQMPQSASLTNEKPNSILVSQTAIPKELESKTAVLEIWDLNSDKKYYINTAKMDNLEIAEFGYGYSPLMAKKDPIGIFIGLHNTLKYFDAGECELPD